MPHASPFDWSASPVAQQIEHLRSLSPEAFHRALVAYDWALAPEPVLGCVDNICLRVNSGFYLIYPGKTPCCQARLSAWLGFQQADRAEGRRGRWMLDERILAPMLEDDLRLPRDQSPKDKPRQSLWRDLLSPIIGLGVDRDVLKYKDPR